MAERREAEATARTRSRSGTRPIVLATRARWAVLLICGANPFGTAIAQRLTRRGMNLCIALHGAERERLDTRAELSRLGRTQIKVLTADLDLGEGCAEHRVVDAFRNALGVECSVRLVVHSFCGACGADGATCGQPMCALAINLVLWVQRLVSRRLLAPEARDRSLHGPMLDIRQLAEREDGPGLRSRSDGAELGCRSRRSGSSDQCRRPGLYGHALSAGRARLSRP